MDGSASAVGRPLLNGQPRVFTGGVAGEGAWDPCGEDFRARAALWAALWGS